MILALFSSAGYAFGPVQYAAGVVSATNTRVSAITVDAGALKSRRAMAAQRSDLSVRWDEGRAIPAVVKGVDILRERATGKAQPAVKVAAAPDFSQKAISVMGALSGMYGIQDAGREFVVKQIRTGASGYKHVRLSQTYRGLPVFGAGIMVHFDAQGLAKAVNGVYRPVSGLATTPVLSAKEASGVALADRAAMNLPAGVVAGEPLLVVFARDRDPVLAYQLLITGDNGKGLPGQWRYWIDALSGTILLRYDDLKSVATPANGAEAIIIGSILTEEGGGTNSVKGWRENTGNYFLWSFTNTWYIYDASISDYAYRPVNNWLTSDRTEMSAARNVEATADYFRQIHGRNSIDDAGIMARADVHNTGDVNAYWDGSKLVLFDELPCALDVCGHEFTHGVTQYSANLIYERESGALNESYSDIFGTLIEFYLQPDGRSLYPGSSPGLADWLMGEDTAPAVGIIRDMRNPYRKNQPGRYKGTKWYTGTGDNGGVHYNSGVQNFFFYLLCEGGSGNNDGIAYSLPGVGIPAGGQIAYHALMNSVEDTDYAASREAWILAAEETDAAGITTNTVYPVMAAWAAVGIGFANAALVSPAIVHVLEGGETNVAITLAHQPFGDVTLTASRYSGSPNLYVAGATNFVFTTNDWNVPQTLSIGALSDSDMTNDMATFILMADSPDVGPRTFRAIQMDLGDTVPPRCTITGAMNADRTIMTLDFMFDEEVAGFTADDILTTNNIVGGLTLIGFTDVSGVGTNFQAQYACGDVLGAVWVTIPAGSLADVSGNANTNDEYQALYTIPWVRTDFEDNFDGVDTVWTRTTNVFSSITTDGWRRGAPVFGTNWFGPDSAFSGSNCWGVMNGPFDRWLDACVLTPPLVVGANPVIRFQLWLETKDGEEGSGYVEVNGGYGWVTATNFLSTGLAWAPQTVPLENAVFGSRAIQVRFRAIGNVCAMYIDDFKVESQTVPSVWVVTNTPSRGAAGTTVPVTFTVYNSTTSSLAGVSGSVSCPDDGVSITAGSPVSYGTLPAGGVAVGSAVSVQLADASYPFWSSSVVQLQHLASVGATPIGSGSYPFIVDDLLIAPATNLLTVRTATGAAVTNWLGTRLQGNGSAASCLFQAIYAGTNGLADPPGNNGQVTGDDHLLYTADSIEPFGRFGVGAGVMPDVGAFIRTFAHRLPSNAVIYVRAWDSASFGTAAAYGDSAYVTLNGAASQTGLLGSWGVGVPAPGSYGRDSNGDSLADGWSVMHGLDPRSPIVPLGCKVLQAAAITDFNRPNRVAVSSNFVFVADTENNRVQVWNRALTNRMSVYGSTSPTEFYKPAGIAVSSDGTRLAVADTLHNRVRLFSVTAGSGTLVPLSDFGSFGTNNAQFNSPMAVAFSPTGEIYVADSKAVGAGNYRVQVFSGDGVYQRAFSTINAEGGLYRRMLGIGVGADGQVFVADGPNNQVHSLAADGTFYWACGTNGTAPGQFNWVWDTQPGPAGLLYVTDLYNNRVQVMKPAFLPNAVVGVVSNAGALGALNLPRGAAPAPDDGVLYVADTYNNRVLRLRITVDADGDGMDDIWEVLHGLNPDDPSDAFADPDHDGVTNIGEYRAGIDPQTMNSGINLVITSFGVGPRELGWLAGSGYVYRLQTSTNLIENNWVDGPVTTSRITGWLSVTNLYVPTNLVDFIRVQWINAP